MVANSTPDVHLSRRALMVSAVAGLGAWAGTLIARPEAVRGSDPNDVVLGTDNAASSTTSITATSGSATVFGAYSVDAATGMGLYANTSANTAVRGFSHSAVYAAVVGNSHGDNTGVRGYSGTDIEPGIQLKTGVYGYAAQDSGARGVVGETSSGHGVHGTATSGFAGYFDGKVYTNSFHEMKETSAPSAPAADKGRLFMRDNGSGKTQLCVRFNTGGVVVIVTQP